LSQRARTAVLVAIGAALVAHSLWFNFVCDDAFITFVYSRNLAEHGQLVFNLGDRVEGYTNFLWAVILAVVQKIGVGPETSSRVLGTGCAVVTLFIVARLTEKLRRTALAWDFVAPALLAASSGYACWSSGGLETQLFTCLALLGLYGYVAESWALSGVAFALAAMTRPEGLLILAVCGVHRVIAQAARGRFIGRGELVWAGSFLLLFAPYFAWRWWYYGWPFPNTAYVKAGGKPPRGYALKMFHQGLFYAWQWATQSKALYAAPLAILGIIRRPRFGSLAALLIVVYLAYAISVGGDFMGLHRFVMPLFVLVAILTALGLEQLADWLPRDRYIAVGAAALITMSFALTQVALSRQAMIPRADKGIDRPGYLKLYAHDRELIGRALAPHMRPDDFSIVGGAGVQPYFARMRAIDVFGLVSEDVAHNEPPSNPRPGHQKWAKPDRLLKYKPSFIFHCYDLHNAPTNAHLCGDEALFARAGYVRQTIHVPGMKERGEYYTFLRRKDRAWP
jgi:arabinofuranosyltransferase